MKVLKDKVAAITGAGSGIGRALANELAANGCHLALSDVNAEGLSETVAQCRKQGVRVTFAHLDVADQDAFYAWADQVVKEHGRVNMIFNNAGVALSGTVADLSIDDFRWIMDINFWGVVYGTKAFLPYLEASGEGHVINISSIFGLSSQPLMSGYNASKFAVRGFTESLRQDLDMTDSCVSTCVHPGGIKTNIARAARMSDSVSKVMGRSKEATAVEFEKLFVTSPEEAARTIVKGVRANRRRVLIGIDARFVDWLVRLAPTGYQRVLTSAIRLQSRFASGPDS